MDELMKLTLPLKGELMTTVRLTTGGVCSLLGFDLDDSEDCKVCVTESLLLLMHRGYCLASLSFVREGGLSVRIEGELPGGDASATDDDEIATALISALAEDVVMEKGEGQLRAIGFRFGNGR